MKKLAVVLITILALSLFSGCVKEKEEIDKKGGPQIFRDDPIRPDENATDENATSIITFGENKETSESYFKWRGQIIPPGELQICYKLDENATVAMYYIILSEEEYHLWKNTKDEYEKGFFRDGELEIVEVELRETEDTLFYTLYFDKLLVVRTGINKENSFAVSFSDRNLGIKGTNIWYIKDKYIGYHNDRSYLRFSVDKNKVQYPIILKKLGIFGRPSSVFNLFGEFKENYLEIGWSMFERGYRLISPWDFALIGKTEINETFTFKYTDADEEEIISTTIYRDMDNDGIYESILIIDNSATIESTGIPIFGMHPHGGDWWVLNLHRWDILVGDKAIFEVCRNRGNLEAHKAQLEKNHPELRFWIEDYYVNIMKIDSTLHIVLEWSKEEGYTLFYELR